MLLVRAPRRLTADALVALVFNIMHITIKHTIDAACRECRLRKIEAALDKSHIDATAVTYDTIEVSDAPAPQAQETLRCALEGTGIQLVLDKKDLLIDRIKHAVDELVEPSQKLKDTSLQHFLPARIYYSYSHLAKLFSESEGMSIEHYLLSRKIDRVKELMLYDNLTLTEIAYRLNYCSVAHLSHQFRHVTGMTARDWKMQTLNTNGAAASMHSMSPIVSLHEVRGNNFVASVPSSCNAGSTSRNTTQNLQRPTEKA